MTAKKEVSDHHDDDTILDEIYSHPDFFSRSLEYVAHKKMALTAFCRLYTTSHSSKKTKAENDQNLKIQKLYIVLTEVASTNINSNTANQYIIKQKKITTLISGFSLTYIYRSC